MILQRVEIAVRDDRVAAFEAALCEVRQRVFALPGFRGFAVAQGVDDLATFLVEVRWESLPELVEAESSARLERCWAPVGGFLAGRPRVDAFTERPGLGLHGPGVVTDVSWMSG